MCLTQEEQQITELQRVLVEEQAAACAKFDNQWIHGVWSGHTDQTAERIIGTPDGVTTAPGLKRLSKEEHSSTQGTREIVALPENTRRTQEIATSTGSHPRAAMVSQRRMYITKALLDHFGRTAGCSACHGEGKVHSLACRTRLEVQVQ